MRNSLGGASLDFGFWHFPANKMRISFSKSPLAKFPRWRDGDSPRGPAQSAPDSRQRSGGEGEEPVEPVRKTSPTSAAERGGARKTLGAVLPLGGGRGGETPARLPTAPRRETRWQSGKSPQGAAGVRRSLLWAEDSTPPERTGDEQWHALEESLGMRIAYGDEVRL